MSEAPFLMASRRIRFTSFTTGASAALFSRSLMSVTPPSSCSTPISLSSNPSITSSYEGPFSA
jgi:hypothetical protein